MGGCHSEGMKKTVSVSSGGWCGLKLKRQMWTRPFRTECMWKEVSALSQELPLVCCAPVLLSAECISILIVLIAFCY